jgi:hypothetical protein
VITDQILSPKNTRGARGENDRRKGEIPRDEEAQFGSVAGSLLTVSGGRGEEDLEARLLSPDLCDRITVAGGPAVR